jgi:hypothetical protein
MATIKLQPSGAVVLKDGKVSCACCSQPPTGCCPYPAQALVDGLYTYQDLPDAIDIDGIEFTKLDPPQFIGGVNQYYINTDGEYLGIESMPSDSVWAYEGGNNACLLNDTGWEDQFANSYTVTGPPGGPVIVTRQSLCVWTGSDSCGNGVGLEFISDNDDDEKVWFIGWFNYLGPCITFDSSSGTKHTYAQGGDGIDTPVGNYYENVGQPPIGSVS